MVSDTTPVTPILLDYIKIGQLTSLEPEHVKPFLTDRLRWRVQKVSCISSLFVDLRVSAKYEEGKRQSRRPQKPARSEDLGQQQGVFGARKCRGSRNQELSGDHRNHHFQGVEGGRAYNGRHRAVNDNMVALLSLFELLDLCSIRASILPYLSQRPSKSHSNTQFQ